MIFKITLKDGRLTEFEAETFCVEPMGARFFSVNGQTYIPNEHIRGRFAEKDGKLVQIDDPAADRLLPPKETPTLFQPGQVVQLKSGGPRMTVFGEAPLGFLNCGWFVDGMLQGNTFNPVTLVLATNGTEVTRTRCVSLTSAVREACMNLQTNITKGAVAMYIKSHHPDLPINFASVGTLLSSQLTKEGLIRLEKRGGGSQPNVYKIS